MKEKRRVELDSFFRKMIELINSRFNKQEEIIDKRTKRQSEIITKLEREIRRLKGRITSLEKGVKLSVDETILKDLGFQSSPEGPAKSPKAEIKKVK